MDMKILQVSDIHGSFSAVKRIAEKVGGEGYDLVVAAGDITNFGTVEEAEALLGEISDQGVAVVFVAGNCDPEDMLSWKPRGGRIINLHLKSTELGGYELLGLAGGGPKSVGTIIEFNEEQFKELLSGLNPSREGFILVSHTPPYGTGADLTGGSHVGSTAIREYVEKTTPILVSCGHIHDARSVSKVGKTTVVNAGPAKQGNCAVITIRDGEVEAVLDKL
ncbi:MAG TPA: YfcE family phosphodiesterase [Candidatus Caldiarchaeum subterraneum]|uniref:YfcE family phosphodiesterase n=1 Tax=Caldiarchaeum subterraneum TaxID=311458 RepID=A0A833ECA1_CALS0|nr:YfcE family phosphodiesterase [Candidatus Caldarchaeum subterraneum]